MAAAQMQQHSPLPQMPHVCPCDAEYDAVVVGRSVSVGGISHFYSVDAGKFGHMLVAGY